MERCIEVPAEWSSLEQLLTFAEALEQHLKLSTEHCYLLRLVIEEIATNIVKYGYVDRAIGVIQLQCFFADHKLHIAIRDQGHPFDPRTVDEPDLTGDVHARAIGGLGLFLVRELADDITYVHDAESGWNELLVIKHTHETQHD